MKTAKKFLAILLSLMFIMSSVSTIGIVASADDETSGTCGDNLTWTLDDEGTLTISGTGAMTDYSYDTSPWKDSSVINNIAFNEGVTSIGDYSFCGCSNLTSVTIPEGVNNIGEVAFGDCEALKKVTLPSTLESIGKFAFAQCYCLEEITLPEGVESIDAEAFEACISLSEVNYNCINCKTIYYSGDSDYTSNPFMYCGINTINIGDNVESIPAYIFGGISMKENEKTKIYLSDNVKSISEKVFDMSSIYGSDYSLDSGLGKMDEDTISQFTEFGYNGRTDFTGYLIYNPIFCVHEGSYAHTVAISEGFDCCVYDDTYGTAFNVKNQVLKSYEGTAQTIVVPSSVSYIGAGAFEDNSTINSIEIPYSISAIGTKAFANCTNLESVIIPFTVTSIVTDCFKDTSAKIYCYYNSYAYKYAVANSVPYELIKVNFAEDNLNISVNDTANLGAAPSVEIASGLPMVFVSSDESVATVDEAGNVTAEGVGTASVKVYTENNNYLGSCKVTVASDASCEHSYTSEVTTPATCTEPGVMTYTCSLCGTFYTEEIPATGHDYSIEYNWEKASGSDGWICTATAICKNDSTHVVTKESYAGLETAVLGSCTEESSLTYAAIFNDAPFESVQYKTVVYPATGHIFENYISNNDATCTSDGTKTAKCKNCSTKDTITDVGSAKGHNYTTIVSPTCETEGTGKCSVCGESTVIPATGHSFTNYVSDNNATCTANGTETAKCDNCNAINTREIKNSALPHNDSDNDGYCDDCKTITDANLANPCRNAILNAAGGSVDYKTKVTLKATATDVPTGYYIAIYDGNTQVARGDNSSVTYNIGSMTSGKTYTVKIVDANGNVQKDASGNALQKDVNISVNASFIKKLVAFFKGLFGSLPSKTIGA